MTGGRSRASKGSGHSAEPSSSCVATFTSSDEDGDEDAEDPLYYDETGMSQLDGGPMATQSLQCPYRRTKVDPDNILSRERVPRPPNRHTPGTDALGRGKGKAAKVGMSKRS